MNVTERRRAEKKLLYFSAYFKGPDYLNILYNPYITFEDVVVFMSMRDV